MAGFDQLSRRIAALESRVNARLDGAETGAKKRGGEILSRIDGVSLKFKQVRYALDELGAHLHKDVEAPNTEVGKQFETLQAAIDAIGEHFAGPDARG